MINQIGQLQHFFLCALTSTGCAKQLLGATFAATANVLAWMQPARFVAVTWTFRYSIRLQVTVPDLPPPDRQWALFQFKWTIFGQRPVLDLS